MLHSFSFSIFFPRGACTPGWCGPWSVGGSAGRRVGCFVRLLVCVYSLTVWALDSLSCLPGWLLGCSVAGFASRVFSDNMIAALQLKKVDAPARIMQNSRRAAIIRCTHDAMYASHAMRVLRSCDRTHHVIVVMIMQCTYHAMHVLRSCACFTSLLMQ